MDNLATKKSKHLHIVLEEALYDQLREQAFAQRQSIGEAVRQAIVDSLAAHQATGSKEADNVRQG